MGVPYVYIVGLFVHEFSSKPWSVWKLKQSRSLNSIEKQTALPATLMDLDALGWAKVLSHVAPGECFCLLALPNVLGSAVGSQSKKLESAVGIGKH